jgi:hypothetical protein
MPRRHRIKLPQLADGEGPTQVTELAFLLDVIVDINLRQFDEVVFIACFHDVIPFRMCKRQRPRWRNANRGRRNACSEMQAKVLQRCQFLDPISLAEESCYWVLQT